MQNHLSDAIIDAVMISAAADDSEFLVDVTIPDTDDRTQRNLRDIIRLKHWEDARRIAEHIAPRQGYTSDPRSFVYPNLNAPEVTPFTHFEGVYLFDGGDNPVHLDESAFDRLTARLLAALIERAERTNDSIMEGDWWQRFLNNAATIEQRVV
jgi:hypothetical protein